MDANTIGVEEEKKTSFFKIDDEKEYNYDNKIKHGIRLFWLFSLTIIITLFTLSVLYATNINYLDLVIHKNLSFEYVANSTMIWITYSLLTFYLLLTGYMYHAIVNIKKGFYTKNYVKRIGIIMAIFYLFIPGFLIYIGEYESNIASISEKEIEFLNSTKYKYTVSKLEFFTNLKETSILARFFSRMNPKHLGRVSAFSLILLSSFSMYFVSQQSYATNETISAYALDEPSTEFIDFATSNADSTGSLQLDNSNFNSLSPDEAINIQYSLSVSKDGFIKIKINDLLYNFDIDGDGYKMIEVGDTWIKSSKPEDRWYVNDNFIPVDSSSPEATPVEDSSSTNQSHATYVPIEYIVNEVNPYSGYWEFVFEFGFENPGEYTEKYVINNSPYSKIFQSPVSLSSIDEIYYKAYLNSTISDETIEFTSEGSAERKYTIDSTSKAIDWSDSIRIDHDNKVVEINPLFVKEGTPAWDTSYFKPYVERQDKSIACFRPMTSFSDYIEVNNWANTDFESSHTIPPVLSDVAPSLNLADNPCPDFYIPVGETYTISFDKISSFTNNITMENPGYLEIGVNVIFIDDYEQQVIYSNWPSDEVVTAQTYTNNDTSNLPIAGFNPNCDYYQSGSSTSGDIEYIILEKTPVQYYYTSATGTEVLYKEFYEPLSPTSISDPASDITGTMCVNYYGEVNIPSMHDSLSNPLHINYGSNTQSTLTMPLYDFNEDGDYSWPSDNVKSISLLDSLSNEVIAPLYGAPIENVYNDVTTVQYQIVFMELYPFLIMVLMFIQYLFEKKYKIALDETINARKSTRNLLDHGEMKYAFNKFKNGEEIDLETIKDEYLKSVGIDTTIDF